jgi:hypothetical protein
MQPDQLILDSERERARRMRGKVLAHLVTLEREKKPMPTNEELRDFVGCDTTFGARHYIVYLQEHGLLEITGLNRGITLTELGREVSGIITASSRPETLFERHVGLTRSKTAAFVEAARRLDLDYDDKRVRKHSCEDIVICMRNSFSLEEVARKLEMGATSVRERIASIEKEADRKEKVSISS